MNRKIILFLTVFFSALAAFSQIPAGYYNNASSKTGEQLRAALRDITTAGHVKIPYTSSSFDIWDAYSVTDTRPGNNTVIWDMYSDIPSGNPLYTYTLYSQQCGTSGAEGDCYSREHQVPNSWWGGLDDPQNPQYSDLHHLPPADQYVNNKKSAHPIGQTSAPSWTSTNGSKVGPCSWPGYTGTVFEPIDEYKGDFARAYLYIATRYMNSLSSWVVNYPGTESQYVINSTGNNYKQWFIDMLIHWCTIDPVSQKEMDRNDAIYYNTPQHNRNPYIDHPEYICLVWSSSSCTSAPTIASVIQNPQFPGAGNTVSVTATVTATSTIASVVLDWGTDGISFPNSIIMNPVTGADYTTNTPIPAQLTGTTVYYRITAQDNLTNSTTSGTYNYTVLKQEPTDHPSGFACGSISTSSITLNWADAIGTTVPDGYLVKASPTSLAAITDPADSIPETNGSFIQNVLPGSQQVTFTGLASSTTYYFKIFPYSNSGLNINYKILPTAPTAACTTLVSSGTTCASDLIISEYVEGSSSNKYIELYNSTGGTVDLSNYRLRLFSNGATTPTNDIALSGVLNNLSTIVFKNGSATVYTGTATTNGAVNFNGDDAIALYKISTASYVDIFGRIGERPATSWTSGTYSTVDKTLVRNSDVTSGVSVNPASGFPTLSTQWTQYNTDVVSNLGSHTMTCATCASPSQAAGNISFSATGETTMTINWTIGNGSKRIVVIRDGSAVTGMPVTGISYNANSVFGSGDTLNTGEFIVFNNSGSSASISNLTGGHTYYISIFEYNCVPGSQIYLTPGTTASRTTFSITTGTVPESQYCITPTTGFTSSIDITSTGNFTGNTYTVQLSDTSGSFATPITIGSLASNLNSETINFTIPANTASGTGYLVRVLSSNPVVTGSSSNPFEIILSPAATAPSGVTSDRTGFCSTDQDNITLTATGGSGTILSWYSGNCGGTFLGTGNPLVIPSPLSTTTYYARWGNTCSTSPCTSVTVTVSGIPTASAGSNISNCNGPTSITMTGASSSGTVNTWSGGTGLGTWTQNSNPALAVFTPSIPAGSFIATLTVYSTSGCTDLSASYTRTISWGTAGYWTGASSTDWFTSSNWCGGVPTSNTNIIIPSSTQVKNSPVISNSFATCQNITLYGTLDFGNNFNLDVNGNWTNNGGNLNNSSGSVTFRGSNKTIGGTINTAFPSVKFSPGCSYTMNNSNSCTALTFTGGSSASVFTLGLISFTVNGSVVMNSPSNSGTNAWNINNGSVTVAGNVTIGSGSSNSSRITKIAVTGGTLTVAGNLLYNVGNSLSGVIDLSGGAATFNLAGSLTRSTAGSIVPGIQSTVNYNGNLSGQSVIAGSGILYNNLTLNNTNPAGALLSASVTSGNITGNISVQSGYFGNNGFNISGSASKMFYVANGATYRLTGSTSMPTGFGSVILGTSSTVEFNGTSSQNIDGLNYGNLVSSGTGARTLSSTSTIGIAGVFSPGDNSYTVTSSTINFNGANQLIPSFNGLNGYNNLSITQNAGMAMLSENITVSGILNLVSGNLNTGGNILTLKGNAAVAGSPFSSSKMIIADGGGELRKYINSNSSYYFPVGDNWNSPEFSPVTINNTSGSYAAGAYTSVKVVNDKHPANANSINYLNRYWIITNSGITSPVYNIDAGYTNADVSGSDTGISMGRYLNTLPWIKYNTANTLNKTLTAPGVNITGSAAFTGINNAIPVIDIQGGGVSVCQGQQVNLITSVNGTAPFSYSWSPAAGLNQADIANPVVAPANSTTYSLTVTDANGFTSVANTTINVNPVPTAGISGLAPAYCTTDGAITLTGSPAGGLFSGQGITGNSFSPALAGDGTHAISYTYTNGFGCSSTFSQQVIVSVCLTTVNLTLKTFLEGYYIANGLMRATKYDLGMSNDPTATDDITVNLWSPGNLQSAIPDYSNSTLLHSNGTATVTFPAAVNGNIFYIAVIHRNSLETWSKSPVFMTANTTYDFSAGPGMAYDDGINLPMVITTGGEYAIYSGDVNRDGTIDGQDAGEIEINASQFSFGYDVTDVNGDASTDGQDASIVEVNANKFLFYARPR